VEPEILQQKVEEVLLEEILLGLIGSSLAHHPKRLVLVLEGIGFSLECVVFSED